MGTSEYGYERIWVRANMGKSEYEYERKRVVRAKSKTECSRFSVVLLHVLLTLWWSLAIPSQLSLCLDVFLSSISTLCEKSRQHSYAEINVIGLH